MKVEEREEGGVVLHIMMGAEREEALRTVKEGENGEVKCIL